MRLLSIALIDVLALAALLGGACNSAPDGDDSYEQRDAAVHGERSARLTWSPPSTLADGTPITARVTYRIYLAKRSRFDEEGPRSYDQMIEVGAEACAAPGSTCSAKVGDLTSGTYYFAVTAVVAGLESDFSNEGSKTIE